VIFNGENMQNLVTKTNTDLLTDSLIVASGCEIQHASVIKLVRKYKEDFEEFGLLAFEIQPRLKGQHGGID
jgi:phage regulator Rha-like protein